MITLFCFYIKRDVFYFTCIQAYQIQGGDKYGSMNIIFDNLCRWIIIKLFRQCFAAATTTIATI